MSFPKAAAIKNSSRVPRYQIREKSTVSAIFRVKPFAKDWKRVWEKVEAPHYSKSPLKKSTMLNGLTIGLF
jgi:hypothetical protein